MEKANKLTKKNLGVFLWLFFLFLSSANAQKSIESIPIIEVLTGLNESTTKSTTVAEVHIDTRTAIEKLSDTDVNIRRDALITVIGERNKRNISHLMKLLKDKDNQIRRFAIQGLVDSGGSTEKVGPAILKLLKSEKDISVQIACMNSLGRIKYKPATDLLTEFLNHENELHAENFVSRILMELASRNKSKRKLLNWCIESRQPAKS